MNPEDVERLAAKAQAHPADLPYTGFRVLRGNSLVVDLCQLLQLLQQLTQRRIFCFRWLVLLEKLRHLQLQPFVRIPLSLIPPSSCKAFHDCQWAPGFTSMVVFALEHRASDSRVSCRAFPRSN